MLFAWPLVACAHTFLGRCRTKGNAAAIQAAEAQTSAEHSYGETDDATATRQQAAPRSDRGPSAEQQRAMLHTGLLALCHAPLLLTSHPAYEYTQSINQ